MGSIWAIRRAAIIREIELCFDDSTLDAEVVAVRLGITPRYVHLLLKETGRTFSEHLIERRLARAAKLLRDTSQSQLRISDIALEAGFADLSHFNRTFRRKYGKSPKHMRVTTKALRRS